MTADGFRALVERLARAWSMQGGLSCFAFTETEGKTFEWHIGNYP